ncbi:MAG TPA: hypothetical protein VFY65_07560 [Longimicrobium sp.]|nr:hypothetical protein [Longimicrobium sp.]
MTIRIIPLLLLWILAGAACDEGGGGVARKGDDVRRDTAAGFRLGMLLPEARAAAAAQGDELDCARAVGGPRPPTIADSSWQYLLQVDNCDPLDHMSYQLQFYRGSLHRITLLMSEDWELIPVDTLAARVSARYGKPAGRHRYAYQDGRRELVISWSEEKDPAVVNLRCPEEQPASECELWYSLFVDDK